jgi:hypothetical protein
LIPPVACLASPTIPCSYYPIPMLLGICQSVLTSKLEAPGCLALAQPTIHPDSAPDPATAPSSSSHCRIHAVLWAKYRIFGQQVPRFLASQGSGGFLPKKNSPLHSPPPSVAWAFHLPSTYPDRPLRVTETANICCRRHSLGTKVHYV